MQGSTVEMAFMELRTFVQTFSDAKQDFCSKILGAKQDYSSNIISAKQDFC